MSLAKWLFILGMVGIYIGIAMYGIMVDPIEAIKGFIGFSGFLIFVSGGVLLINSLYPD